MSAKREDSGQAFPLAEGPGGEPANEGMTMRQYYKAAALTLLAGRSWDHVSDDGRDIIKAWVISAAEIADAMIAEDKEQI